MSRVHMFIFDIVKLLTVVVVFAAQAGHPQPADSLAREQPAAGPHYPDHCSPEPGGLSIEDTQEEDRNANHTDVVATNHYQVDGGAIIDPWEGFIRHIHTKQVSQRLPALLHVIDEEFLWGNCSDHQIIPRVEELHCSILPCIYCRPGGMVHSQFYG